MLAITTTTMMLMVLVMVKILMSQPMTKEAKMILKEWRKRKSRKLRTQAITVGLATPKKIRLII